MSDPKPDGFNPDWKMPKAAFAFIQDLILYSNSLEDEVALLREVLAKEAAGIADGRTSKVLGKC